MHEFSDNTVPSVSLEGGVLVVRPYGRAWPERATHRVTSSVEAARDLASEVTLRQLCRGHEMETAFLDLIGELERSALPGNVALAQKYRNLRETASAVVEHQVAEWNRARKES